MKKISIGKASEILGVSIETLRRWESEGKLESERTINGHRRYDLSKLHRFSKHQNNFAPGLTCAYARVSSHDQKKDLQRQVELLEAYCSTQGWQYEIIKDLGSGLNYNKKGLKYLLTKICLGNINRLVLTHKDRLLRFGSEIVFSLCEHYGVEIVILNVSKNSSFEDELVQDVLEIITVFSARLYGARSKKNKKLLEELKDATQKV